MIIGKYSTVSVAQSCIRALASYQCGLHWNPVVDGICSVCCWFSPLLQDIFLRVLRCSSVLKNQHFQIPIRPGIRYLYVKNHYVDVLPLNRYLFIIPYIILITTIFVEDNTIIVLLFTCVIHVCPTGKCYELHEKLLPQLKHLLEDFKPNSFLIVVID